MSGSNINEKLKKQFGPSRRYIIEECKQGTLKLFLMLSIPPPVQNPVPAIIFRYQQRKN